MNYIQTEIDGVWLIEPRVFSDERGYFMEAYKKEEFEANIFRYLSGDISEDEIVDSLKSK